MVKGKKIVRISFEATSGMVGGIFGVRLLRNKPKPADEPSAIAKAANSINQGLRVRVSQQTLQIESDVALSKTATVKIYSMDGRLQLAKMLTAGANHFDVDIAALKNGNYILRLIEGGLVKGYTIFSKNRL